MPGELLGKQKTCEISEVWLVRRQEEEEEHQLRYVLGFLKTNFESIYYFTSAKISSFSVHVRVTVGGGGCAS